MTNVQRIKLRTSLWYFIIFELCALCFQLTEYHGVYAKFFLVLMAVFGTAFCVSAPNKLKAAGGYLIGLLFIVQSIPLYNENTLQLCVAFAIVLYAMYKLVIEVNDYLAQQKPNY